MKIFDDKDHAIRFSIALVAILSAGLVIEFWSEHAIWLLKAAFVVLLALLGLAVLFNWTRTHREPANHDDWY